MKQTISKNLKRLRKENGKLQKQVAADLNLTCTSYQNIEYGKCEPSATLLVKIKKYYNLQSIEDLFLVCS